MAGTVDLTPFGFTPTESQVYGALLRLGPSTGYALAHATRVARANTYGALEGLAGRAAAIRLPGRPARYRAVDPRALIAQLAAEQGQALDRLSQALRDSSEPVEPESRAAAGARAAANLVMQLVARAGQRVEGVLAAELLRPSLPAWRRARERATLELRVAGEVPVEAGSLVAGSVPPETPTVLPIDDAHAVVASGAGEGVTPIVFLHGLGASMYAWRKNLEPVAAAGYRVIAFDNRGFGFSGKPATGYDNASYARLTVALLDALHLPDAVLIGHSMGGAIAAEVAIAHPERVRGLVLIGSAGLGAREPPLFRVGRWPLVGPLLFAFRGRGL